MTEIKKNHSLQRIRLMKQAAVIRQSNGMSRHDALVTAHRIGKLIRQMHHGNVCFRYTKQDGTIRRATGTLIGYEHSFRRPYTPKPENTFVVYYDIDAKGWRTFHAEIFWISKWNESTGKKDEPAGKRMNLLKKKMNLQEKGMNQQERKEWEALCRQYNVDSLQEAIQGCREELEFLIHCAERLEPPTEQDEDSKKRRLTHTRNAAFPH